MSDNNKTSAEEYLSDMGLDIEVSYEDFNWKEVEKVLKAGLQAVKDRDSAVKDAKAVKNAAFMFVKLVKMFKDIAV